MGIETAIGLGLAALGSATQIIQGANAKSEADQAANNAANQLARIQEADKFKALQVPTLGLELAQQNLQTSEANQLRALQEMGAAGALGGLTALNQQSRAQDLQLAAQANQMQYQRDAMLAENAQQLEQNKAQRESALASSRLQGAQMASAQGAANMQAGIAGLGQLGGQFALAAYKNKPLYNPATETTTTSISESPEVKQTIGNTQNAFAPQIASMKPSGVSINNPTLNQAKANVAQANYMTGLRGAQGQYEASQLAGLRAPQGNFDSQYQWDPYNNQWIQKVPY
jgi:hypothetical protein